MSGEPELGFPHTAARRRDDRNRIARRNDSLITAFQWLDFTTLASHKIAAKLALIAAIYAESRDAAVARQKGEIHRL
jgi:hypothetical protein